MNHEAFLPSESKWLEQVKGDILLYLVKNQNVPFSLPNYHLLLRSQSPNLKALLKFAMKGVKTNIMVEPYDPGEGRFAVRYMTKAKTAKYKNGELLSKDRWARKRVLLRQELKIRKYGTIGAFWPQGINKDALWDEIKSHERKIADELLMQPPLSTPAYGRRDQRSQRGGLALLLSEALEQSRH